MAWVNGKRTVRCRHCYMTGHNIRNCPSLTKEQKADRGLLHRACSYCHEGGHNRKTCQKRTNDMREYAAQNREHRQKVLQVLKDSGINIGALITTDDEDTYPKDEIDLRIVTGFAWDEVQVKDRHRRFIQTDCVNGEDGRYGNYAYNLPRNPLIDMTYGWSRAKVLSKRDTSDIDVPAGWLDGTSGIDKYFP